MAEVKTNYFVCTLGEAAQVGINRPYTDVNQLIDLQARNNPDRSAIGFYDVASNDSEQEFQPKTLTFSQVRDGVLVTAHLLQRQLEISPSKTIALLAASSPEFLFTWLACIRLGLPVLLLAPQLSASAIAHLCKTCDVWVLLTDEKHEELGGKAVKDNALGDHKLKHQLVPFSKTNDVFEIIQQGSKHELPISEVKRDDIAYLHHTSGTSSGLPKPIPQSHNGAIAVLPALSGENEASFSTTPLYHGAPADIFRAWSSNAMIWLFPSKHVPITAANISKCLDAASTATNQDKSPAVKYFASVPYILQMMIEDGAGVEWLQKMDLVSVGGAALPAETGDQMVKQNINLVSRFGSAECGFLLSSHREYSKDKEWQYLRLNKAVTQIKFEDRDGGQSELVVQHDWPHMAKRNREDGSFASADLFVQHSDIQNAWKYHSRADSQLTLITGKKFDPSPTEDAMAASSPLVSDVLIFGNGKPYPGALLFRSQQGKDKSNQELLNVLGPVVEKINAGSQSHSRIPRNMLIFMPFTEMPLEKSSKGTVLRNKAYTEYEHKIEEAYNGVSADTNPNVPDEDVDKSISRLVETIMGDRIDDESLDADTDLFSAGVDSVACVQIRHALLQLLPKDSKPLPLTVVEESRTIARLSKLVIDLRHGGSISATADQRDQIPSLIQRYSRVPTPSPQKTRDNQPVSTGRTILLTGPTGSLGSHVFSQLLALPTTSVSHIYLLVRGATPDASRERVLKAFSSRNLSIPDDFDDRVTVLPCKLSSSQLGLSDAEYSNICGSVTHVFHLAWQVNFLLSVQSFSQHLAGIQNLLSLLLSSSQPTPPRMIFCSSVASVSDYSSLSSSDSPQGVPERVITNPFVSGKTGYAISKLAAELILSRSATIHSSLYDHITIARVGQLSADTQHGVWNKSEAYPQILASSKFTDGKLPDLGSEERLTWLPVDIAARGFVEAGLDESKTFLPTLHVNDKKGKKPYTISQLENKEEKTAIEIDTSSVRVVHLLNPDMRFTFTDFLRQSQKVQPSITNDLQELNLVPAKQWLEKLEKLQHPQSTPNHNASNGDLIDSRPKKDSQSPDDTESGAQSLLRLLPFWKQIYADRQPVNQNSEKDSEPDEKVASSPFDVHNSLITMPSLTRWLGQSTVEGRKAGQGYSESSKNGSESALLEEEYVRKIWRWVRENVP